MDELTRRALVDEVANIIEDYNERQLDETSIDDLNGEQLDCIMECLQYGQIMTTNTCEWQCSGDFADNTEFKVQCNHNPLKRGIVPNNFSYQDFKFCPYCSRKIVWR